MSWLALFNHALNFVAPAIWLALLMPPLSRFLYKKRPLALSWYAQAAIHLIVCFLGLLAGLVVFGNDGKMLTYLAVVLLSASSQWVMLRAWR